MFAKSHWIFMILKSDMCKWFWIMLIRIFHMRAQNSIIYDDWHLKRAAYTDIEQLNRNQSAIIMFCVCIKCVYIFKWRLLSVLNSSDDNNGIMSDEYMNWPIFTIPITYTLHTLKHQIRISSFNAVGYV